MALALFGAAFVVAGCSGSSDSGSSQPVTIALKSADGASLTVGKGMSCVSGSGLTAKCWGRDAGGRLGAGGASSASLSSASMKAQLADGYDMSGYEPIDDEMVKDVSDLTNIEKLAAGESFVCALTEIESGSSPDPNVECWGTNENWDGFGGADHMAETPEELYPDTLTDVVDLDAQDNFGCAITESGKALCWGEDNRLGQLGSGDYETKTEPVEVAGFPANSKVVQVSVAFSHSCALIESGALYCWGDNFFGQLGSSEVASCDGVFEEPGEGVEPINCHSNEAVKVDGIATALQVAAGGSYDSAHSCALLEDHSVHCWGDNFFGQLGNGDGGPDKHAKTPVKVVNLSSAIMVSAGHTFSCALIDSDISDDNDLGTVKCWGSNLWGRLGSSSVKTSLTVPSPITEQSIINAVKGMTTDRPVNVTGLENVVAITGGFHHNCALRSDGAIFCWGSNIYGELAAGDALCSGWKNGFDPGSMGVMDDEGELIDDPISHQKESETSDEMEDVSIEDALKQIQTLMTNACYSATPVKSEVAFTFDQDQGAEQTQ